MHINRFTNSRITMILMLLTLFPPEYLMQFSFFAYAVDALTICTVSIVFLTYFQDLNLHRRKRFNLFVVVLFVELFFATLFSEFNNFFNWFKSAILCFTCCFFAEEISLRPYKGIQCMYYYFSICVIINTATIFIFPNALYANNNGFYNCWFLGEDNGAYIYYLIATMFAMMYHYCVNEKTFVLEMIVIICSFLFVFHNDIATGIFCQIIWLLLFLAFHFKLLKRFFKARYILYIAMGGLIFLVLTRDLILEPITRALGRSTTLTGRTLLWDIVLNGLSDNLLFGYGMINGEEFDQIFLNSGITNAHNWVLMLAVWGGVIAVVIFVLLVIEACRESSQNMGTTYYGIIVMHLVVITIRFLVEGGSISSYLFVFSLLDYSTEYYSNLHMALASVRKRIRLVFKIRNYQLERG